METKKSKLGLGIFMGVLIGLIIGLSGFIIYDKVVNNNKDNSMVKDNQNVNDNDDGNQGENSDDVVIKDLSLGNDNVKQLVDEVIGVYTNNVMTKYSDYFYKNKKIILENEDISFKISLASESVKNSFKKDSNISYIDEDTIKNAYYKLFGNDGKYIRSTFTTATCEGMNGYSWSNTNNRYEAKIGDGCGGTTYGSTMSQIGYAKQLTSKNKNVIELYEYFAYEYPDDENNKVNYYSDYAKTNLITTANYGSLYQKNDFFNKFSEKSGLYKYTFEKDSNGNYIFKMVENLK